MQQPSEQRRRCQDWLNEVIYKTESYAHARTLRAYAVVQTEAKYLRGIPGVFLAAAVETRHNSD